MTEGGNIYFASDFHLGSDAEMPSKDREKIIVSWLDKIENDAAALYLMGDIFDYWFEYAEVAPRGFLLLLGKLAQMRMKGIPIFFFTGNHDMWVFDYLKDEIGMQIISKPVVKKIKGKNFLLAHGDGLGKVPFGDRLMKAAFSNKILQWLFARIHPNSGIRIMKFFSNLSRKSHKGYDENFIATKEYLVGYSEDFLKNDNNIDYFVFGHRHIPVIHLLSNGESKMINLGDWISNFTYGIFDGNEFKLEKYEF